MKFGLPISFTFHVLAAFGGMLLLANRPPQIADVKIIPLELVTVSDVTDIKPTRSKDEVPEIEPEPEVPSEPEPVAEVPEIPPEPESDKLAEATAPVFDLDALEKALKDVSNNTPNSDTQKTLGNENPNVEIAEINRSGIGAETDSTVNALDYIRARLRNCWIVDEGAVDYQSLFVDVHLWLNRDGSIQNMTVLNDAQIIASGNRSWPVARHNALTALRKCAPYDGLLSIDYDVWKELKLHLDPGEN